MYIPNDLINIMWDYYPTYKLNYNNVLEELLFVMPRTQHDGVIVSSWNHIMNCQYDCKCKPLFS
jgi:hypothetical protein